jgi:hypothetical protein
MRDVAARRFGDVDRQVADALEVRVDLHCGDDGPEVGGHRLVEREKREAAAVDFNVQRVQWLVTDQRAVNQVVIAVDQPLHGETHLLFCAAGHLEQPRLELLQLFLEMNHHPPHRFHQPNRPVT